MAAILANPTSLPPVLPGFLGPQASPGAPGLGIMPPGAQPTDGSQPTAASQAPPGTAPVSDRFAPDAVVPTAPSPAGSPLTAEVVKQMQAAALASAAMPQTPTESLDWGSPSKVVPAKSGMPGRADPAAILDDPSVQQSLSHFKQDAASIGARIRSAQPMSSAELTATNGRLDGDLKSASQVAQQCGLPPAPAQAAPSPPPGPPPGPPPPEVVVATRPAPKLDRAVAKMMTQTERDYYATLAQQDPDKAQLFALQTKLQHLNEIITQLTQLQGIRHDNAKALLQNLRV